MFLDEVRIKNFRSLKDVSVKLDKTTILIGENNAGKTSFLDAIKMIFGRQTANVIFNEYDYCYSNDNETPQNSEGIQLDFIFKEQYEDQWNDSVVQKYFEVIQNIPSEFDNRIFLNQIWLRIKSKYNPATDDLEVSYNFLNDKMEELSPKSKSLINDFLKDNPAFYLKALRDTDEMFSNRSPMWGRFLKKVNIPPDKLIDIQTGINNINNGIVSNDENLKQLVSSLASIQRILEFNEENTVSISAIPLKTWDLISKSQVILKSKDNNASIPLERHGQGTQSISSILLFQAYIEILLKQVNNKNAEAILTLEEPEAHLHPQAIRAMEKQLSKIECQKIITTHSPYFIQNADIRNIKMFKKDGFQTKVFSISDKISIRLSEIPPNLSRLITQFPNIIELNDNILIAKEPINGVVARGLIGNFKKSDFKEKIEEFIDKSSLIFTEEEIYNLNSFVQKTRGELFFARAWLMAEGQTEAILLPYFTNVLCYDLDEKGVSYIDYRNNGSAKAFTKLAKALDVKWSLLADNDKQGEDTIKEIEANGYTSEEIEKFTAKTTQKDIEYELVNSNFINDYEFILKSEITQEIEKLKEQDINAYKEEIVKLIQKDKVGNAYKLVERLKNREMSQDEIPELIQKLIKRVCLDGE